MRWRTSHDSVRTKVGVAPVHPQRLKTRLDLGQGDPTGGWTAVGVERYAKRLAAHGRSRGLWTGANGVMVTGAGTPDAGRELGISGARGTAIR